MCVSDILTPLYENDHYIAVIKPRGLSTAPLKNQTSASLVDLISTYCPAIRHVSGKSPLEGGLLHRLDRDTEGLVLFAKTQDFYDALQLQAANGSFQKTYLAHCYKTSACLAPQNYTLESWEKTLAAPLPKNQMYILQCAFVKAEARSARVRPLQHHSKHATKKLYTTKFHLSNKDNYILAVCYLDRGFRHQVRSCLSSLGLPIFGDPLYPTVGEKGIDFCFWATAIRFLCPYKKQWIQLGYNPANFVKM